MEVGYLIENATNKVHCMCDNYNELDNGAMILIEKWGVNVQLSYKR